MPAGDRLETSLTSESMTGFQPVLTGPTRKMNVFTASLAGDRLETCLTLRIHFESRSRPFALLADA